MKNRICSLILVLLLITSTSTLVVSSYNEKTNNQLFLSDFFIVDMIEQVDQQLVFYYHDNLMRHGVQYMGQIHTVMQYLYCVHIMIP